MSWTDPEGPWQHAQRKRIRSARLMLGWSVAIDVLVLGMLIGISIMFVRDARMVGLDTGLGWLIALPGSVMLLFCLLPLIPTIRRVRVERTLLRLVPAHDGLICVKCRIPGAVDDEMFRCGRCEQTRTAADTRSFWAEYPHQACRTPATRTGLAREGKTSIPGSGAPRALQFIWRHPGYAFLLQIGLWLAFSGAVTLFGRRPFLDNAISYGFFFLIPIAFMLWQLGTGTRVGDGVHCASCDYERDEATPSERCPECNATWRVPGGYVRGSVTRYPPLRWAAVAVGAIFVLGIVNGFARF